MSFNVPHFRERQGTKIKCSLIKGGLQYPYIDCLFLPLEPNYHTRGTRPCDSFDREVRLPLKCDYRTDRHTNRKTDARQSDHYKSLCQVQATYM